MQVIHRNEMAYSIQINSLNKLSKGIRYIFVKKSAITTHGPHRSTERRSKSLNIMYKSMILQSHWLKNKEHYHFSEN